MVGSRLSRLRLQRQDMTSKSIQDCMLSARLDLGWQAATLFRTDYYLGSAGLNSDAPDQLRQRQDFGQLFSHAGFCQRQFL